MTDTSTVSSRRRPLYTCGASALTIVWNLYKRAVELSGPIGLVAKRLTKLGSRASPLVCVIQYQWLVTLSFIDGYILSIEKIIEKCVPPSRHVFDKIDSIDNLPMEFEYLMNRLPTILEKITVFEWVVKLVSDSETEKEIRVDTNCDNVHNKQDDTSFTRNEALPAMKCSYKEALEKGVKEDENAGDEKVQEIGNDVKGNKEDPLVELLDFGWETPRTNKRTMSRRSASYT